MVDFLSGYDDEIDLSSAEVEFLENFLSDWGLLSDLALSDLILWVPNWHGKGYFALGQIRPATVPSLVPEDLVGEFLASGRNNLLDQAYASKKSLTAKSNTSSHNLAVIPILFEQKVIGLLERTWAADGRGGRMETIYLAAAAALLKMLEQGSGSFLPLGEKAFGTPRVGDGLIKLDSSGIVEFASPNAQSAFRRMGLNKDLIGENFANLCTRLMQKKGLADETLTLITSGKINGEIEIENNFATLTVRSLTLLNQQQHVGAVILVHDITLLRKKERALLNKDAIIREVHHRVKNNLQTVGSLLRLQARRASSVDVKNSLNEADRRISTIAIVHETLSQSNEEEVYFDEILQKIILMLNELNTGLNESQKSSFIKQGSLGTLKSDLATALAMALVEILQNALEHGVPALQDIEIDLANLGNELSILVKDYGPGLKNIEESEESLGLQIVDNLVKSEMGGTIDYKKNQPQGLIVEIKIPLKVN